MPSGVIWMKAPPNSVPAATETVGIRRRSRVAGCRMVLTAPTSAMVLISSPPVSIQPSWSIALSWSITPPKSSAAESPPQA
jgi:hypothetical protein